jgi:hypothetical protein
MGTPTKTRCPDTRATPMSGNRIDTRAVSEHSPTTSALITKDDVCSNLEVGGTTVALSADRQGHRSSRRWLSAADFHGRANRPRAAIPRPQASSQFARGENGRPAGLSKIDS